MHSPIVWNKQFLKKRFTSYYHRKVTCYCCKKRNDGNYGKKRRRKRRRGGGRRNKKKEEEEEDPRSTKTKKILELNSVSGKGACVVFSALLHIWQPC